MTDTERRALHVVGIKETVLCDDPFTNKEKPGLYIAAMKFPEHGQARFMAYVSDVDKFGRVTENKINTNGRYLQTELGCLAEEIGAFIKDQQEIFVYINQGFETTLRDEFKTAIVMEPGLFGMRWAVDKSIWELKRYQRSEAHFPFAKIPVHQ